MREDQAPIDPRRPWMCRPAWAALALLLSVVVVYVPALSNGFVFDDEVYVTGNENLTSVEGLGRIWTEPGGPSYTHQYYPLSSSLLWVEYQLWGPDPVGYHAVNIVLHGLNAILLFGLLRRLRVPGAWLAGVIFAVHPVHVQSVAWISELKNVLSTAFFLGSAHLLLQPLRLEFGEPSAVARSWGLRSYALGLTLFVAALLSKTATAVLPIGLLLLVWWRWGRVGRRELALLLPLVVMGVTMITLTVLLEGRHTARGEMVDTTMLQRWLIAGASIWFYAWKLIWPVDLMLIYPRWDVDVTSPLWYAGPIIAFGTVAVLYCNREAWGRGPLVAVVYFMITVVPVSLVTVGFARYTFVADHWQYWGSMGLIALAGAGAIRIGTLAGRARRLGPPAAAVIILSLGIATWRHSRVFERPLTLWGDNAARNDGSWLVWLNWGTALARNGRLEEAISSYEHALGCGGATVAIRSNLGLAFHRQGRLEAALEQYRLALTIDPGAIYVKRNLGSLLEAMGSTAERRALDIGDLP